MKKMLLLLNPKAGMQKANKGLVDILNIFNRADYQVEVYVTAGPKDAGAAIQRLAPGKDLVVCCGGDGTFNETVTGLMDAGLDIPIGYLPAGSTNDFANSMGLATNDLVAAAKQIVEGAPRELDLGKFEDRYFSYVASFGAFSRTSYNPPQSVKNALGHTAYLLSGIQELSQIRKIPMRFEIDGEMLEGDYIFGAICNSTSLVGLMKLDPSRVVLDDGKFEMLLIPRPKTPMDLQGLLLALLNQQYDSQGLIFRHVSSVTVEPAEDLPWSLDGEFGPSSQRVEIVNHKAALRFLL